MAVSRQFLVAVTTTKRPPECFTDGHCGLMGLERARCSWLTPVVVGGCATSVCVVNQRQHVLVGAFGVQRHPHRKVRHRPGRQRPTLLLGPATRRDHRVHDVRRENLHQQTHRHQIRQPPVRLGLPPTTKRRHAQPGRDDTLLVDARGRAVVYGSANRPGWSPPCPGCSPSCGR